MYMLLTGEPPFDGSSESEIVRNIQTGIFDWEKLNILDITAEGQDLLSKLLEFSPSKRISAEAALHHPWSKMFDEDETNQEAINDCLKNLENFKTE
jgi:serine/threonine protein kinase